MTKAKSKYEHLVVVLVALYTLSLLLQHSRLPQAPNIITTTGNDDVDADTGLLLRHDNNNNLTRLPKDHFHYDKERIIDMLVQMQIDPYSIDNDTWKQVPTWTQVTNIWGTKPVLVGMEQHCAAFRKSVPPKYRHVAVAGIFSTGTNLLAQLLQHNCGIPERIEWMGRRLGHGMEWQVPYGKHNPFRYREQHQVKEFLKQQKRRGAKLEHYLPVATIRDPYDWFGSICRHPYTFRWPHTSHNCPHMVHPNGTAISLTARFGADPDRVEFPSLAHVWNEFYGEYFHSTTPAIMVRFEDLIFFPKEMTKQVCECAGGQLMKPHQVYSDKEASGGDFHYVIGSSLVGPGHGKSNPRNGLIDAWIKYANPKKERQGKLPKTDVDFSEKVLDRDLVQAFEYDR